MPHPWKITDRPEGRQAFRAQSNNARKRGIPFLFDFETWWAWWQVDGRWERRGVGKDKLVMARCGDVGPYAPGNVYCASHDQNRRDVSAAVRSAAAKKSAATAPRRHLAIRGIGHPRSKMVSTPAGRFGSAALAAEHYGIERQTAARWAREGRHGWSAV